MNHKSSSPANITLRLLGSCILLLSGLIVYWQYQPDIYLFKLLGIDNSTPFVTDTPIDLLLKNHFADAVWCLALLLAISISRDFGIARGYRLALLVLPFISETMQSTGVIPGVFDWVDMAIYLIIMSPAILMEFNPMRKMENNIFGSITIAFFTFALLASGRPPPEYATGTFTFTEQEDDIFTKTDLVKSLNLPSNPSIVLRVPNPSSTITKEQNKRNSVLYNLIEKEFAKAGFVVRDRQLFSKVLEQETNDYSKIGLVTETDFIVELLSYSLHSKYQTKSYVDEDGKPAEAPYPVSFNGAIAEFKLVSLKKNDLVGSYTFHWAPCTEGCKERFDKNSRHWNVNNAVPTDFFKKAAQQLARELRLVH